jgi:hypothetical protein
MDQPATDEAPRYERRVLVYFDILGWTELVSASAIDPRKLRNVEKALDIMERLAEFSQPGGSFQTGQFSDHVVMSAPATMNSIAILAQAVSGAVAHLLLEGQYARGAIVVGNLVHQANRIYGPALNEAHAIESRVAKYPRIVFSPEALALSGTSPSDPPPPTDLITSIRIGETEHRYQRVRMRRDPDGMTSLLVLSQFAPEGLAHVRDRLMANLRGTRSLDVTAKLWWLLNQISELELERVATGRG